MMGALGDFFYYITSPIIMFIKQVADSLLSASNYVLNFLMSFLEGIMNILQAVLDAITGILS